MSASMLDQYYINVRYPTNVTLNIESETAEEAFNLAKAIVEWSESCEPQKE